MEKYIGFSRIDKDVYADERVWILDWCSGMGLDELKSQCTSQGRTIISKIKPVIYIGRLDQYGAWCYDLEDCAYSRCNEPDFEIPHLHVWTTLWTE